MARIANYSKDTIITGGDKVIGTNQANGDTVNFLVEDLANYISSIADIDVSVANLKIRLPQIDSNVTIGNGSDVDTTISGDLNVNGDLTVNGAISALSVENSLSVVFSVKNTSGELLPKGTVVHVASTQSSQGNIIDVVKADNSSSAGMPAIGILNVQLADDGEGEAVVIGRVNHIDTSAFASGDELYVNTNGNFTNVKPTGTALIQKIAVVIKSHASNGSIEVFGAGRSNDLPNITLNNIWLGNASGVPTPTAHTVENITDVNITNLQDNQILKYNSSTSQWENEADSVGAIDGTGAANKIAIWSDADTLTNDTNLHWDTTNDRLGIGESNPSRQLHVKGSTSTYVRIEANSSNNSAVEFADENDANVGRIQYEHLADNMTFRVNDAEAMRIDSSGNVGIGTTSPNAPLDIRSASTSNTSIKIENSTTGGDAFQLMSTGSGTSFGAGVFSIYSNDNASHRFVINSSGNVGIGTTTPSSTYGATALDIKDSSGAASISLKANSNRAFEISSRSGDVLLYDTYGRHLRFGTGGGEKMRITSSGNVGIGTTSPSALLHVSGSSPIIQTQDTDGTNQVGRMYQFGSDLVLSSRNNTSRGSFSFQSSNGTDTVERMRIDSSGNSTFYGNTLIDNGVDSTLFIGKGLEGVDGVTKIKSYQSGADTDQLGLKFFVHPSAAGSANTEVAMTIDHNKNVGIGTSSPSTKLQVGDGTADDNIRSLFSDGSYVDIHGYGLYMSRDSSYIRPTTDNTKALYIGASSKQWNTVQVDASTTQFLTNGSEHMRINSLGRVGIGTTSPFTNLTIYGATDSRIALLNSNSGTTSSDGFVMILEDDSEVHFLNRESAAIKFSTAGTERMRIDSSGRVGINQSSPTAGLHVVNSSGIGESIAVLEALATKNGYVYINADDNRRKSLVFQSGGVDKFSMGVGDSDELSESSFFIGAGKGGGNNADLVINSSGNVGIGTSSPSSILDIQSSSSLAIRIGNSSGVNGYQLKSNVSSVADFGFVIEDYSGTDLYQIQAGSGGFHRFLIDGSEKVRIDSIGRLAIGTSSPAAGAILDITATNKGVLFPRLTTTQINTIQSPENGLMVYNTTLNTICFYNGTSWQKVSTTNM